MERNMAAWIVRQARQAHLDMSDIIRQIIRARMEQQ
jgi:hypothetical protein